MKLLGAGTGEDERLNELIRYWIVERDSVPCFMAALTLQCFETARRGEGEGTEMQMTRPV